MYSLIIGSEGQDGKILKTILQSKRLSTLEISRSGLRVEGSSISPFDLLNYVSVRSLLTQYPISRIYYLAAHHHSSTSLVQAADPLIAYRESAQVNVDGLVNFLSAIVEVSRKTRLFYASSCLIFGDHEAYSQSESTKFDPTEIYGITKAQATWLCRHYRHKYNVHACAGILYNHESGYRKDHFLSSKIIKAAIRISRGSSERLTLGSIETEIDWGYAPDYVQSFIDILDYKYADDYIVASGNICRIREFVDEVFKLFGLEWQKYIDIDPTIIKRSAVPRVGSPDKLRSRFGTKLAITAKELARKLVQEHIELADGHGEYDASDL